MLITIIVCERVVEEGRREEEVPLMNKYLKYNIAVVLSFRKTNKCRPAMHSVGELINWLNHNFPFNRLYIATL